MYTIKGTSLADTFKNVCQEILTNGVDCVVNRDHVQDNGTIELCPAYVEVTHPEWSIMLMDERAGNPFAQIFETLWVYSGQSSVETLKFFIPRAPNYADNETHWRGAYGPRLRDANGTAQKLNTEPAGSHSCDQIKYIINTLTKDPSSRRAIMTIWDPVKEDTARSQVLREMGKEAGDSKDYPCNIALQFLIRDGKLKLIVKMRSNDALYGFSGINVFEWTWLQCMIAGKLGVEVGSYHHEASSLHVYKNVVDKVTKCAGARALQTAHPSWLNLISKEEAWNSLDKVLYKKVCEKVKGFTLSADNCQEYLENWSRYQLEDEPTVYLALYCLWKHDRNKFADMYINVISHLKNTDMKLGAVHFFNRNTKGVNGEIQYLLVKGVDNCGKEVVGKIQNPE